MTSIKETNDISGENEGSESQRKHICESLEACYKTLDGFRDKKKNEFKSVVLTNEALELHDLLESTMNDLKEFRKHNKGLFPEKMPISSLTILLPDLAVAAVLWDKDDGLINDIKLMIESLRTMLKCEEKSNENANTTETKFNEQFDGLKTRIEDGLKAPNPELRINHDFLSQQVDQRSNQVFTMGPLFVPISFLIFVYAVTSNDRYYLGGVPLMFASLSCYSVWFIMYLRTQRLNRLSYPLIHSLELMLGISTHSSLFQIREKHWLIRWGQHVFYTALYALVTLWVLFLSRLTEIQNLPWTEIWNPVSLTFSALSLAFVLSLVWKPSVKPKDLAVLGVIIDLWISILATRFSPPFLAALSIELLICLLVIWIVLFITLVAVVEIKRDP